MIEIDRNRGQFIAKATRRSDGFDHDVDFVAGFECEGFWRNDAGTGEEDAAVGEAGFAIELFDKLFGATLHGGESGVAGKYSLAGAADFECDGGGEGRGSLETRMAGPSVQERS